MRNHFMAMRERFVGYSSLDRCTWNQYIISPEPFIRATSGFNQRYRTMSMRSLSGFYVE